MLSDSIKHLCSHNLSIFPLVFKSKKPKAGFEWKEFQTRRPTDTEIESWCHDPKNINLALVTGKINGFVVLDVDNEQALIAIEKMYGQLPSTVLARTSRGYHYFFNYVESTGDQEILEGVGIKDVDYRADGNYVVAVGSTHESGAVYEWIVPYGSMPLADAPQWLVENRSKTRAGKRRRSKRGSARKHEKPNTSDLTPDLRLHRALRHLRRRKHVQVIEELVVKDKHAHNLSFNQTNKLFKNRSRPQPYLYLDAPAIKSRYAGKPFYIRYGILLNKKPEKLIELGNTIIQTLAEFGIKANSADLMSGRVRVEYPHTLEQIAVVEVQTQTIKAGLSNVGEIPNPD